jgi:pteridine reductase
MVEQKTQKTALITGSGRPRVGSVVARALADDGYALALHYHRSADSARNLCEQIQHEAGVPCAAFQADVASESEVDGMLDAVLERFGRLDVLVTTASIWETIPLEELRAEDLLRNFSINTLGTFLCARRSGLIMADQEAGGVIVTIGDWAIQRPYLDHAAYFVSKGAIATLTRTLAVELAHRNPKVRVNGIHPGPVMFPPDASEAERGEMIDSTLVKNANCPESIAIAVRFFIDNPFVTGVCLPVDGGRTVFAQETTSRGRPI